MGPSQENNRRRHERFEFAHPVRVAWLVARSAPRWSDGMLHDVAVGGACIALHGSPPGTPELGQPAGRRIKLEILDEKKQSLFLFAVVRWLRAARTGARAGFQLGVEFEEMDERQLEKLQQFIRFRGKDQKMLWSLWDTHLEPLDA